LPKSTNSNFLLFKQPKINISSYLYKTKLFRRHRKQISTTVAAFFIVIFSAPIFELIEKIYSRISCFKSFLKVALLLRTRFCTSNVSVQNLLDTCLWHVQYERCSNCNLYLLFAVQNLSTLFDCYGITE